MAIETLRQGKLTPGVYDAINEAQIPSTSNISTTALGVVGETTRGPAFEIVAIKNWTEFKQYFGGTSTEKFKGNNFPKYELPYVAQEYLKESNNLYVTRALGLSGYDAGRAWGIVLSGTTIDNEIGAVIRSKGTLNAGQTMTWEIGDDQTLKASGITLTESFNIDVVEEDSISGLSIPVTGTTLTGTLSRNGVVVTSGSTFPAGGLLVDITDGFFGGVVDTSSVTGTTIAPAANEYKLTTGTYDLTGQTLTITGVQFELYNTPLHSSVVISTSGSVVISNVTVNDSGELVYTAGTTITLTSVTINYFLKAKSGSTLISVSLENTDTNFILNVLGSKMEDVDGESIWVDEYYLDGYDWDTLLADTTLTISLVELPKTQFNNFKSTYQTPRTPWIVSQVVGGKIKNLFRGISISDGESANTEIKLSIENVDTTAKTFDLLVRSFGDTDDNVVILESYRNLNLIKDDKNYIARRIGDSDGEYNINSKYIVIEMADGTLHNESPSGFRGFPVRNHTDYNYATPSYKTSFDEDIKVRRQYLGIQSSTTQTFDLDFLKYKGVNQSTGDIWGVNASEQTNGFHIQTEASVVTGFTIPSTSPFIDPDTGDLFEDDDIKLRYKFTTMFFNGFDGWNIYSENRGLTSDYKYNKTQGKAGLANQSFVYFSDTDFPEGTKAITSDYYAYYKAIRVFSNPKTVDINLFATPGIDWVNYPSLCDEVIDMVENERFDALYIVDGADSTDNTVASMYTPKEVGQLMEDSGFDTKYSTTFYPWVQFADVENDSKTIWLPPTKDVVRSIAYTDNIAFPWFAPAGFARGTVNANRARTRLKKEDTEYLTAANVNYVETFVSEGLKLWGERLMRKNADSWVVSRIGVLRLTLYLRANIRNVVNKDIFEQNDDVLVDTIRKQITPILDGIAGQRGIERDYVLEVLQTPEDKDARQVRVKVYIKPIGAVEFIEIEFNINPSSVSFS